MIMIQAPWVGKTPEEWDDIVCGRYKDKGDDPWETDDDAGEDE